MKILFDGRVFSHTNFTGVENYSKILYQELSKNENITLLKPKSKNKVLQHLWEHLLLPWKSRKYNLLFSPANVAPIWKPKNTKLVITLHDNAFITHPQSISKLFYFYYKHTIPKSLKIADRVITISEFSRLEIIKSYPFVEDKIEVIYNGVDRKQFYPIDKNKKEKYILFVGSLNPRKNFLSLIQAFEKISTNIDIKLKIVGNFADVFALSIEEQDTIKTAKENNRIVFLENIDNKQLVELYQKALIFIFPSTYEGFGLPPLEAMACGTPVISSNVASLPEVCGDSVVYIDPFNVDDIAKKIDSLLQDISLQNKLRDLGLGRVKNFSWSRSAKEHIQIFKEAVRE